MTDRAVVDDDDDCDLIAIMPPKASYQVQAVVVEVRQGMPIANPREFTSEPRALVALSEDRQWLAVLDVKNVWNVMEKRYGQATHGFWWKSVQDIRDTGQDAQDVLAAFLEGRDA